MRSFRFLSAFLAAVCLTVVAAPAAGQATLASVSPPVPAGVLSSVAYDRQNHVYLHVWEYARDVWGRFYYADGTVVGASFIVAPNKLSFAGRPEVAYGGGVFLVTYISDVNNFDVAANVFGQLVMFTGGGATGGTLLGGTIMVSPNSANGAVTQYSTDVIYNPVANRFLVAWDEFGSSRDALVRQFATDGSPIGAPVNVSNGPGTQGAGMLAYDWQTNKYLVAFIGDDPQNLNQTGVFARILDGNTAAPGGQITLTTGFTIEPAVAYLPEAGSFVVTWTSFNPTRDVMARQIASATGNLGAPYAVIAQPGTNEGAAVLDYDFVSRTVLVAAMSDTLRIIGTVMSAVGTSPTPSFLMSSVVTNPANGQPLDLGTFNPALRPAESGLYGLVYIIEYAFGYMERWQLPPAGTPGPSCCGGGPPPPPPAFFSISPTTWSVGGTGGNQFVTITAPDPGAAWSATSAAPSWLTVSPANGVGSGGVTLTAASNAASSEPRMATVNVAGQTVTVTQAAGNSPVNLLSVSPPIPAGVLSSLAYDKQNHVYLHVWEFNRDVIARFYYADGSAAGAAFVAATHKLSFAGRPKLAAGGGKFFLTYISDVNNFDVAANAFGQIIVFTGSGSTGGAFQGGVIRLSPNSDNGAVTQYTTDVIYNPVSNRFLTAWDEFGSSRDVMVRQFGPDGAAIGAPLNVSNGPGSQGAGALAYDWQNNKYLAAFIGDDPLNPNQTGVFARILDGDTAAPGGQITLTIGFTIEPATAYLPEASGFLVTWTSFNPTRDVVGRLIPTSTGIPAPVYAVIAQPGTNEGAAVFDYDHVSRKVLVAAMSDTLRIIGSVLTATGAQPTPSFLLSSVSTHPQTGQPLNLGSFNPVVRPAESGIFGLTYIIEYQFAYLERYQLPAAGQPGPSCCGAPQPYYTVSPTSWNAGSEGGNQFVTLTPLSGTTPGWNAVSNAAWLTVSGGSGSGAGGFTMVAAPNTGSTRNATVTVDGQTITVTQPGIPNLASNGNFSSGLTGWQTFATPDLTYVVASVTNGVMEFYRLTPAPQFAPNQAVVLQPTGVPVAADAPIGAQFDLGNSSSVRKRISVLLHDNDFSDLHVCSFWLDAGAPMRTYVMRTHSTEAWSNATISFYAATEGSDGGAYRVDNVSVFLAPWQSTTRTDCVDPTTPAPTVGADGPELIVNGGFSNGMSPWQLYGQISSQVVGGVFEFIRPSGTPAGVVLQPTGAAFADDTILSAQFDLGNTSNVRKRVTVVMHDLDFSDLAACTYWLDPGQPLSTFVMRTHATRPWANATLSFYMAVVDTAQWARLDNVSMKATPSQAIVGTECVGTLAAPDSIAPMTVTASTSSGTSTSAPAATSMTTGNVSSVPIVQLSSDLAAQQVSGDVAQWSATGAFAPALLSADGTLVWVATAGDSAHILTWQAPVDLRQASDARLSFFSARSGGAALAEVQVSIDGQQWASAGGVGVSDEWTAVDVDLSAYAGQVVFVRFVYSGNAASADAGEAWVIGHVSVRRGPGTPAVRPQAP